MVPGLATALRTRTGVEVVRMTVSGGDDIICTPDHQFMMNDGSYRTARDLRFNDSLMPLYRQAQMAEVGTANISQYMAERPEHFREAVAGNGRRGAPYLTQFNTSPRACIECGDVMPNPAALRWHKQREHGHNHKVIAVEVMTERADVYCLQVDKYHNFALAAGVFVHNCGMIAARTPFTAGDAESPSDLAALRRAIEAPVLLPARPYHTSVYGTQTAGRLEALEQRDGADTADN